MARHLVPHRADDRSFFVFAQAGHVKDDDDGGGGIVLDLTYDRHSVA